MTVTAKPIVLNDDGTKHVALPDGFYIDNASIDKDSLISKDTDNLLKTGSDGKLLVADKPIADLVDTAKAELSASIDKNTADITDLKADLDAVTVVSGDANNLLVRGSDNGAKVTASDLLSNGSSENLLKVNAVDKRLEVAKSDVQAFAKAVIADTAIVSNDAGNLLIKGSDKGAYLDSSSLRTQVSAGSGISVDADRVSVNVGKSLGVNSANQLYVDTNELTTVLATKEEVKTLQRQVEVLDTENMNFAISRTKVDPVTLDKGEAALYPSEDLLG